MLLSAETFQEIVAHLHGDASRSRGSERRKTPRVGVRARVELERIVCSDTGVVTMMAQLREISPGGIGFTCNKQLTREEHLKAYFPRNDGGCVVARYVVRHCTRLSTYQFLVGCELTDFSEEAARTKTYPRLRFAY